MTLRQRIALLFESPCDEAISTYQRAIVIYQEQALAAQKATLDLAVAWRISLEQPEVDLSEDIDTLIRELSDQVAKLEEYVV